MAAIDEVVRLTNADLLYAIKGGGPDGRLSQHAPTAVHAVFPTHESAFHGTVFAFVSDWLSAVSSNNRAPVVPHIVNAPASPHRSLRAELAIPENATVFGCHGGADSFDISFAKECVAAACDQRPDVVFVFLNITPFIQHTRIIFLPGTADAERKTAFIDTCDAMLHARRRGETFGLACAEFSVRNRPILTYSRSPERNHIEILSDKAFLYSGRRSLMKLLLEMRGEDISTGTWDCYSKRFSPERVMKRFEEVFLEGAQLRGITNIPEIRMDKIDRLAVRARKSEMRMTRLARRIFS